MYKYEHYAFLQYLNSTQEKLSDAYNRPSVEKQWVYTVILARMKAAGGKRIRIISHNIHYFSCAYLYKKQDKVYLAVFRPSRSFDIDVTDTVLAAQV